MESVEGLCRDLILLKSSTKMPFRLACKLLSLTISQCSTPKTKCMENIHAFFGQQLEWAVIAQEDHADGGRHLHVGLKLRTRCDIKNATILDCIGEKHGQYERMRSLYNWITYISKEDKEPEIFVRSDSPVLYRMLYMLRVINT